MLTDTAAFSWASKGSGRRDTAAPLELHGVAWSGCRSKWPPEGEALCAGLDRSLSWGAILRQRPPPQPLNAAGDGGLKDSGIRGSEQPLQQNQPYDRKRHTVVRRAAV
ncbi:hypothetical protein NDU88_002852 [Pleurodeles waltl]|uniref:Uncharacterized protein n=1 Tax=Pleurodeles waltl TaxID=8319 RepID=A0AAV7RCM5_PLEWA|nr:hypothetical protein NDU88_002852 [Pleurodeles waltl]